MNGGELRRSSLISLRPTGTQSTICCKERQVIPCLTEGQSTPHSFKFPRSTTLPCSEAGPASFWLKLTVDMGDTAMTPQLIHNKGTHKSWSGGTAQCHEFVIRKILPSEFEVTSRAICQNISPIRYLLQTTECKRAMYFFLTSNPHYASRGSRLLSIVSRKEAIAAGFHLNALLMVLPLVALRQHIAGRRLWTGHSCVRGLISTTRNWDTCLVEYWVCSPRRPPDMDSAMSFTVIH
jgi:hypothetical protein